MPLLRRRPRAVPRALRAEGAAEAAALVLVIAHHRRRCTCTFAGDSTEERARRRRAPRATSTESGPWKRRLVPTVSHERAPPRPRKLLLLRLDGQPVRSMIVRAPRTTAVGGLL